MLTVQEIRNAKPGDKPYKLFDAYGLYLLVMPTGGKLWRMKYRFCGKEKLLAFGSYDDVSLARARTLLNEARKQLEAGIDPSQARKAEKRAQEAAAENSFETVARAWHDKQRNAWADTHAQSVLRRLEVDLFPALGHRPIAEIEAPELLAAMRVIESRGAFDLAHRVLAICGQVFRFGVATGHCTRNPAGDLRGALTSHKAQHQAAVRPEELPELLRRIDGYDRESGDTLTRLALQLMSITFVRTAELIGARWEEFDMEAGFWIIPAARMKMKTEHVVPLSSQALAILTEVKPLAGHSPYVFPGRNRDKPLSNNTLLYALYRLGYKGRMTGHGFRAVASTILNEAGFRADVIERQLAHCERDEVRGAYNRAEYLPERKTLMQWWGNHLDSVKAGARIEPFRRAV